MTCSSAMRKMTRVQFKIKPWQSALSKADIRAVHELMFFMKPLKFKMVDVIAKEIN